MTVPERLGDRRTHVVREAISAHGRRVILTLDQGAYQGARPYYGVSYLTRSGRPQVSRYTPRLERAEWLFGQFAADITDPARLADPAAQRPPEYGTPGQGR